MLSLRVSLSLPVLFSAGALAEPVSAFSIGRQLTAGTLLQMTFKYVEGNKDRVKNIGFFPRIYK